MKTGLIKFKYGEEIIAEYQDTEKGLFVENTAALMPTENFHWHLVTWMPYTNVKNGFLIPKSEIWFIANLSEDMDAYYQNWKKAVKIKLEEEKTEVE